MSELSEILKEEYLKELNKLNINMLLEMIEDAVEQSVTSEEVAPPDIPRSKAKLKTWADVEYSPVC